MAELRKNEKLRNSITEAAWVEDENATVEELNDKDDIRKAFAEHKGNFSIPILSWEILHMSWISKTGFWYDGVYIAPCDYGEILRSGFDINDSEGDVLETYEFGDFFDNDNICLSWEPLVECMVEDIADWHRYIETKPF